MFFSALRIASLIGVLLWPACGIAANNLVLDESTANVPRTVLAVYDGRYEASPDATRIHELAELPLNHLGYRVKYWDVNDYPPDVAGTDLAAVLTWFDQPLANSISFFRWTLDTMEGSTKLIVFGSLGEEPNWASAGMARQLFRTIGLEYTGETVVSTYRSEVRSVDPDVFEFERPLAPPIPAFPIVHRLDRQVTAHVTLATPDNTGTDPVVVVATGPKGGFAASNYIVFYEPLSNRTKWLLNPFAFFYRALGQPSFPIPDVTTISGRRIYISHIDGDGWDNVSEIERYRDSGILAARVTLEELIRPYPDLPVTVGLIAGDIDPELSGTSNGVSIARELFALPQVEVASHTYTHPFDWEFYEPYDRQKELAMVDTAYVDDRSWITKVTDRLVGLARGEARRTTTPVKQVHSLGSAAPRSADDLNRYVSGSDDLPRQYLRFPFDLKQEIVESLEIAGILAPDGKPVRTLLWSGDTNPTENMLRFARQAGIYSMNGGDSRYDSEWPSLAYVPPIARPVGNERQIYAINSNENTYTNDWTGPYFGLSFLAETLRNTENPRRLKGVNVYYHMYSGEKPAAVAAVKRLLDEARRSPLTPIRASQYIKVARGFFTAEIVERAPLTWEIRDRQALATVRFDNRPDMIVDITASQGVIGYTAHNGSLYVSLDPAVEIAIVHLTTSERRADGFFPWLVESRWRFSNVDRTSCSLRADVEGFGPGEITLAGLRPGKHRLLLTRGDRTVWQDVVRVSEDGILRATMDADGRAPLSFSLGCT